MLITALQLKKGNTFRRADMSDGEHVSSCFLAADEKNELYYAYCTKSFNEIYKIFTKN